MLGFEPMTYGSESECAIHYTTAPHYKNKLETTELRLREVKKGDLQQVFIQCMRETDGASSGKVKTCRSKIANS